MGGIKNRMKIGPDIKMSKTVPYMMAGILEGFLDDVTMATSDAAIMEARLKRARKKEKEKPIGLLPSHLELLKKDSSYEKLLGDAHLRNVWTASSNAPAASSSAGL